jgi:signal transduction histidine kinase
MNLDDDEEKRLQAVAIKNATSIFVARQRAEHELVRTREALEAKTEALARALALMQESLGERDRAREEADAARREAQAANDAKSRFVNMVSHELRTPLGAIAGYAALLEEGIAGTVSADQREYIQRIRTNQSHLLELVNELLDLAKIESGQFPLDLEEVVVNEVIDSVGTMIEPQLQASNLRLEVESCAPSLRCHADPERVKQIVLNLLSNALKFTPEGGVVKLGAVAGADAVMVHVSDSGIGIPVDKLDAVFEPFFQIQSSQHRGSRGTGLGLAISRELARSMRGDLTVESTPGRGSTFTLSLPHMPAPTD